MSFLQQWRATPRQYPMAAPTPEYQHRETHSCKHWAFWQTFKRRAHPTIFILLSIYLQQQGYSRLLYLFGLCGTIKISPISILKAYGLDGYIHLGRRQDVLVDAQVHLYLESLFKTIYYLSNVSRRLICFTYLLSSKHYNSFIYSPGSSFAPFSEKKCMYIRPQERSLR